MNNGQNLTHWHFALTSAFFQLERWVFMFDIENEPGQPIHAGIDPVWIRKITEGFLTEKEQLQDYGSSGEYRLMRILNQLNEKIIPIYERGRDAAIHYWQTLDKDERYHINQYSIPEYRNIALNHSPQGISLCERNWFIESFGMTWTDQWINYVRQEN